VRIWNEKQRSFILHHLNVDMTAKELARIFRVAPQEVWQLWRASRKSVATGVFPLVPTAFHSPGGGMLLKYWGIRGATRADEYAPVSLAEFQEASHHG
jgi:hypothetical protein